MPDVEFRRKLYALETMHGLFSPIVRSLNAAEFVRADGTPPLDPLDGGPPEAPDAL